jgi:hypothetical protein
MRVVPVWLLAVVTVGLSLAVALVVCEGTLRALALYRPPAEPIRPEQPEIYHPDPDVGYTLWPSRTTTHRYPPSSGELITLTSNSDGFRNAREFDDQDGRRRILVVGDSFVFGLGVRAEDRLTEQLEGMESAWRVDNMGMTGWGLDLMVRALEHLGRKADPDVVVLLVYTDDFRRVHPYYAGVGYAFPKFELIGTHLTSHPYIYPKWWERLRIVQAVYQTRWQLKRDHLELNGALLARYEALAKSMGFTPVVVFVPGLTETEGDRARRTFLTQWVVARQIRFLDLTPAIYGAGVANTFIKDNWHWSPLGHRIAAQELLRVLSQQLGEGAV